MAPAIDLRSVDALGLPIDEVVPLLLDAMRSSGSGAVLVAEPGAGKSTVVPLRLLAEPWSHEGRIVMLEPRRIAARSVACRMADLLHEPVGQTVGYRTRDERKVSAATRIEVVTEGLLTRRLLTDPELNGTALVVFDELHERSLHADVALALTLEVRDTIRPDLRVLAMSATIDADRVALLLSGPIGTATATVPVVRSTGRAHPVAISWDEPPIGMRPAEATDRVIRQTLGQTVGDLLVFLPGAGEIERVAGLLRDAPLPETWNVDVHRLYGARTAAEQDTALRRAPEGRRKVVLATDLAETSLTVEGVTIVIDSGLARTPHFSPASGFTSLRTESISKASADQRAGRAGRTGPGRAIRLWNEAQHRGRPDYSRPEILGADLSPLALTLAAWGTTDPVVLALLDPPPPEVLASAWALLVDLGAVDGAERITSVGHAMVNLPLHPRLAAMIVQAKASGDGARAATACAAAALLDGREPLAAVGTVDLAERVRQIDRPRLASAGRRAADLARRAGVPWRSRLVDADLVGPVLAIGFSDRVAQRVNSQGGFRLRSGLRVQLPDDDPLVTEPFLVVADLRGLGGVRTVRPKGANPTPTLVVASAAAIDEVHLRTTFGASIEVRAKVQWDDTLGDVTAQTEERLGALVFRSFPSRPAPGEASDALRLHLKRQALRPLPWRTTSTALRQRLAFLHTTFGDPWPDVADAALDPATDPWLEPWLAAATGVADLNRIDVRAALLSRLPHYLITDLDRLAPADITLSNGRTMSIQYDRERPTLSARVQEFYGVTETPVVAGGQVALTVELLSPARRPIQTTNDLAGFWIGSWKDVRKDMRSRYPKHSWPEHPEYDTPKPRPPRSSA